MSFIDFRSLKEQYNIEDVAKQLGLKLKQHGEQYRGPCPACEEGGDRALVITPTKSVFYCFAGKTGGDIIALASHVLGVGPKDAALAIAEHEPAKTEVQQKATVPSHSSPKPQGEAENVLQPLGHLEHKHEHVQVLFTEEDAKGIGSGWCKRGLMKDRVAIPLRTETGKLVGYLGWSPEDKTLKLPPKGLRL